MTSVLLVPDLPLERWPSMDRYALRLAAGLRQQAPDLDVTLAAAIDTLTADTTGTHPTAPDSAPHPMSRLPSSLSESWRYLNRYWLYPRRIARLAGEVVHVLDHSYAHVTRVTRERPCLVTVHDLLPLLAVQRKAVSLRERIRNRLLQHVLVALRGAHGWIVATDWLRTELAQWLERDDGISVIPYGVDEAFFEPCDESRAALRRQLEVPEAAFVVLHVGSVGPRKNVGSVIATVAGLRRADIDAWFVQAGGILSPEHRRDIDSRGIGEVVRALGPTTERRLRDAYRAADVLLFPSHYEGFGLPVLEAMASGLPVVTSGAGGLRELAGEAAVTVGGREVAPYVTAVKQLLEDPVHRGRLIERGLARARTFRWSETARQTAALYRRMA